MIARIEHAQNIRELIIACEELERLAELTMHPFVATMLKAEAQKIRNALAEIDWPDEVFIPRITRSSSPK